MAQVHDQPSDVVAEAGAVLVDGPDGVAVTLTPEAAADTSDRLLHAANQAAGQRIEERRLERERRERHPDG